MYIIFQYMQFTKLTEFLRHGCFDISMIKVDIIKRYHQGYSGHDFHRIQFVMEAEGQSSGFCIPVIKDQTEFRILGRYGILEGLTHD